MARPQRIVQGGPGYVGLIIFIVLCLVLIGGYIWLVPQYAKRGSSIVQLQRDIKTNIEDRLRGQSGLSAASRPSPYDVAYERQFFTKVGDLAADGVKYRDLVKAAGYEGENPIGQITDELGKSKDPQKPQTLREYVAKLNQAAEQTGHELDAANKALEAAYAARDRAQRLLDEESKQLKDTQDKNLQELEAARKSYDKDLTDIKGLMAKANEDAKKAWAENSAQVELHKKQIAELQARILRLEQDLRMANDELQRKRPKGVAVTEGRILQADGIEGVAIIDMGKREGIQNGEKFTVVRIGKGGDRIPKGELQVVRVESLVSRADIIKSSADDPVMRDDVVQREKKTE